jgi:hypothetical protein
MAFLLKRSDIYEKNDRERRAINVRERKMLFLTFFTAEKKEGHDADDG